MRKINLLKPSEQTEQVTALIARFKRSAIVVVTVFVFACLCIMAANFYALNQNNTLISSTQQYTQTIQKEKEVESLYTALHYKVLYAERVIADRFPFGRLTASFYESVPPGSTIDTLSISERVITVSVTIPTYDQLKELIEKMQHISILKSYKMVVKETSRLSTQSYSVKFEYILQP